MPELIVVNLSRSNTGVSATAAQVARHHLPHYDLEIAGFQLSDLPSPISMAAARRLSGRPPAHRPFVIWHARRNREMQAGIWARDILRLPIRLVFSSAAQRYHSHWPRWLISRMDAVIATTPKAAEFVPNVAGVVPHGVDEKAFFPAVDRAVAWKELGYPGKLGVATIGRVRPEKGTDRFVEAMIQLLPDLPDVTALVIGRTTRKHHVFDLKLKDRVQRAGLINRILFVDEVEFSKMPKILRALTLVVQLPRYEGYGIVPLQGLASGTPFVGSDAGNFMAFSNDGETGRIIDSQNITMTTQVIRRLIIDHECHADMAKKAVRLARTRFGIEQEASGIATVYEKLWSLSPRFTNNEHLES
ncbi:MAG: glycosyltransferase family 4 protein [Aestuariivita sp.]|nr:glycosyltransferase family 4 protein [Aestuariivita sp.]MCY4346007.1 glycosyltransferase family 4 protein [Aestuariivita sp.]